MKYEGLVFAALILYVMTFLISSLVSNDADISKLEASSNVVEVHSVVVESALPTVKIDYEVQYGSFYTGNQTPIVHYGSDEVVVNESYGIGYVGLPITGYGIPIHSQISLNLGDNDATLFIACGGPIANEPWQPNGLLRVEGVLNGIIMNVSVVPNEDGTILVRADPKIT